jgi:hypothetical protein
MAAWMSPVAISSPPTTARMSDRSGRLPTAPPATGAPPAVDVDVELAPDAAATDASASAVSRACSASAMRRQRSWSTRSSWCSPATADRRGEHVTRDPRGARWHLGARVVVCVV